MLTWCAKVGGAKVAGSCQGNQHSAICEDIQVLSKDAVPRPNARHFGHGYPEGKDLSAAENLKKAMSLDGQGAGTELFRTR